MREVNPSKLISHNGANICVTNVQADVVVENFGVVQRPNRMALQNTKERGGGSKRDRDGARWSGLHWEWRTLGARSVGQRLRVSVLNPGLCEQGGPCNSRVKTGLRCRRINKNRAQTIAIKAVIVPVLQVLLRLSVGLNYKRRFYVKKT